MPHLLRCPSRITIAAAIACAACTALMLALALRSSPLVAGNSDGSPSQKSPRIARGRYLVRITGCNDCHTPGYVGAAGNVDEQQWLTGDTLGFQGPWGTTYPANLRKLIQGMSLDSWLQYARKPTRPPMPWFALRDMSEQDLAAIYEFVRSLGPSAKEVPVFAPPGTRVTTAVVRFPE
jgi:mono/diheme cytochrome c family protein